MQCIYILQEICIKYLYSILLYNKKCENVHINFVIFCYDIGLIKGDKIYASLLLLYQLLKLPKYNLYYI